MNRHLRVLHVEDNADDRWIARDALAHAGIVCTLVEARDGVEALLEIEKDPPDWIMLDLRMPRMDGLTFLAELRKRKYIIPVTVLTTAYAKDEIQEAYRRGANSYVTKPLKGVDLSAEIGRLGEYWTQHVCLPREPK